MLSYFIRRLLLVPVTFLGISLLVFTVSRFAPGGPLEQALQQATQQAMSEKGSKMDKQQSSALTPTDLEKLEESYGFGKGNVESYLIWLGVMPREALKSRAEFVGDENETRLVLKKDQQRVKVVREGDEVKEAVVLKRVRQGEKVVEITEPLGKEWIVKIVTPEERKERWKKRPGNKGKEAPELPPQAIVYQSKFFGLLQGNLGRSLKYNDKVWDMIKERIPIALFFGLSTLFITYGICIPLGIIKAIKHRTWIDNLSSVLIFVGYSIPGFALGAVLVVYLGARMELFPLSGMVSPNFDQLSLGLKVLDILHHTTLPLLCYLVGGFAVMTMMMKNNLMDNLAADYVRTAVAKGVSFRAAVFKHAFRNSIIPIATGIGNIILIFLSGNMLVERVFDINGFGLLGFQAVVDRDYTLIMGVLAISAVLMLLANILSDIVVAFVDPRIKFQ